MTPTSAQFRAARALLGLPLKSVAYAAGVSVDAVFCVEHGRRETMVPRVQAVLEAKGVRFIPDGVVLA